MSEFDPEEIGTLLIGLLYYLYRQAGCPYSDSMTGLNAWVDISIRAPFSALSEQEEEEA